MFVLNTCLDQKTVRVAIVDDDAELRSALSVLIEDSGVCCCAGVFGSAEEALTRIHAGDVDVLLLDIGLPGISGADAVTQFLERSPGLIILMLTVYSDRPRVFASICNGAKGYLLKSTPPARLLESIQAAHQGGSPLSPEIARGIVSMFQQLGPPKESRVSLTNQEQRLLTLLAQGHSYDAAAKQMNVSVNTIRNYIRNIYDKLHVHSKSAAVVTALRQGLLG